jgi:hypothetical protein
LKRSVADVSRAGALCCAAALAVEKDGDDALVVFGRSPGYGLAQLSDGV